jgi:hypothetical protein
MMPATCPRRGCCGWLTWNRLDEEWACYRCGARAYPTPPLPWVEERGRRASWQRDGGMERSTP